MKPAAGRDRHEADHDGGGGADRGRLAVAQEVEHRPDHERPGGGEHGVHEGEGGGPVRGERAAGVEAEPAEPQQARAEEGEGHVVRQDRLPGVVLALADHDRGHEGGGGGVDVDDGAAREVERAHLREEAAAPDPVRDRGVDDEAPQRDEREVGPEAHPLDDRARHQGGGDDRERALVGHEQEVRDRALRLEAHPGQAGLREPAHEGRALGEGEAVAEERPGHADEAQRGDAHHHGVEGVLGAHEAPVEERQRRRHQQHQRGRNEHPGRVGRDESRCVHLESLLVARRTTRDEEQEACAAGRHEAAGPKWLRISLLPPRPRNAEGESPRRHECRRGGSALQNCRNEARPAQPRFSAQRPRVKSGNSTGALPRATDSSLRADGALHAAAS